MTSTSPMPVNYQPQNVTTSNFRVSRAREIEILTQFTKPNYQYLGKYNIPISIKAINIDQRKYLSRGIILN